MSESNQDTLLRKSARLQGLPGTPWESAEDALSAALAPISSDQSVTDANTDADSDADATFTSVTSSGDSDSTIVSPSNSDTEEMTAHKCKLPPFWPDTPDIWFLQAESVFSSQKLEDDAEKFHRVVAVLDQSTIKEVSDVLSNPPSADKYKALKNAIITRTADSEEKKLQEAMSGLTLGDSKPSQLWRQLKQRAGSKITDDALIIRWLDLLPQNISMLLKIMDSKDTDKLTTMADKLLEQQPHSVAAVSSHAAPAPAVSATYQSDLAQEVQHLRAAVTQLTAIVMQQQASQQQRTHHQHHRGRSRSRSRSAGPPGANYDYCWYHRRHGAAATRCTRPCSFPGNTAAAQQTQQHQGN